MGEWIQMPFGVMSGVGLGRGVLDFGGDRRRGRCSLGWIQCRNGVLIDYRLVCEKLTIFPYAECIVDFCEGVAFLWYSEVQDRIRGWREIQVQKHNKTDATWRYAHVVNSHSRQTFCCSTAYTGIRTHTRAKSYSARLVLYGNNMLELCDPSNLLLILSAEEWRALLKLLWGGLVVKGVCI